MKRIVAQAQVEFLVGDDFAEGVRQGLERMREKGRSIRVETLVNWDLEEGRFAGMNIGGHLFLQDGRITVFDELGRG